uniref:Uncharacterized protein n=1 Tax=Peronospora matthiolae TaxID=2874970 RepID=A0AAV1UU69_9STRA
MDRNDLKRKAPEPLFVSAKIAELTSELKKNDAMLREEIQELRDEISDLKTQLTSKTNECSHMEAEAQFLHPDAVMDRVRTKFWHHGDLSLLRRAIDPRTRKLRVTKSRGDQSLYLCDTAPKKAKKTHVRDGRSPELMPKQEYEQTAGTEAADFLSTHPKHDVEEDQDKSDADCVSTRGEKEQDGVDGDCDLIRQEEEHDKVESGDTSPLREGKKQSELDSGSLSPVSQEDASMKTISPKHDVQQQDDISKFVARNDDE